MCWRWQRIPSIVEISRNAEVDRRAPEQLMATYQWRKNTQQILTVKKATEHRNLGTLIYNIKCKCENQVKKEELGLEGEGELYCM
jgi:hypothetical protein